MRYSDDELFQLQVYQWQRNVHDGCCQFDIQPLLFLVVEMAGEAGGGGWFRFAWHWLGIGLAFPRNFSPVSSTLLS